MVTHGPATEKTPDVEAQKRKGIKGRLNEKHTTKALYPHLYGKRRGKKKKEKKRPLCFYFPYNNKLSQDSITVLCLGLD